MAEVLPLYPQLDPAPLEEVLPLERDSGCKRCPLSTTAKSICIPADGEAGGVLVVGDHPGKEEDAHNRVFYGISGVHLRRMVSKHWKGKIAYDSAVRCCCTEVEEGQIDACRPYLAQTLIEAKPSRVLCVGRVAAQSVLGRDFTPVSTRRAWGWLTQGPVPIPVFMLHNPVMAAGNDFLARWFDADINWALNCPMPPRPPWDAVTRLVLNGEDARTMGRELRTIGSQDWFTYDVETAGTMYNDDFRLLSISFCVRGSRNAWSVHYEQLEDPEVMAVVLDVLADPRVRKGGQNVKYDNNTMRSLYGCDVRGIVIDTRLMRKVLSPEAEANLDAMADLIGLGGHKAEAQDAMDEAKGVIRGEQRAIAKATKRAAGPQLELPALARIEAAEIMLGKPNVNPKTKLYAYIPRPTLLRYNARDAMVTTALAEHLEAELAQEPYLSDVWEKIGLPAARAVEWMEFWGVGVNRGNLNLFGQHIDQGITAALAKLHQVAPGLNPSSVPQVQTLLFKTLGLTPTHYTANGAPSTDEDALSELKHQHPVAADLLTYRHLQKMQGYATGKDGKSGLLEHIRGDGRVHGSINLDGARSGRMSMSDPNLQNIPSEKNDPVLGKLARDCYAAPPGYVLLSADYSQLELRVAAMLSGDPEMKQIFIDGVDYHQRTAELISFVWNKKPEEVGATERRGAKAFNFGILYGMSDAGIAERAGCTEEQAARIRSAIFGRMAKLKVWTDRCLAETTVTGEAWTWWDGQRARRRPLWRIGEKNKMNNDRVSMIVATAKHSSWNTPVQGTAADFCTASAGRLIEVILHEGLPCKMILPIHDALLFEVREKDVPEVADAVRAVMTGWPSQGVPLDVDMEIGPAWGSLEKLK